MAVQESGKRQNFELARGINAIAANSLARTNGRFAPRTKSASDDKKVAVAAAADASKTPAYSAKKWYPADYIPKKLPSAKTARNSKKTAKLRASITPGTVLILLSGRFRGKRVVFLKQLPSGTLLVTGALSMSELQLGMLILLTHNVMFIQKGPYKVNGVPLRRVNQAFVIATSTKVDLTDVTLPEIDDSYFAKEKPSKKESKEDQFFAQASSAPVISEQRKQDQKAVDVALMKKLKDEPYLQAYLNAKFTLTKNDRVHELQF